ncbi:hypothetical protein PTMSG1_04086 [Pyrenophora teres f. maculata]|nr:hypothetical protein PTMSG1_04086 [Pyrenophora teres f. maculata]
MTGLREETEAIQGPSQVPNEKDRGNDNECGDEEDSDDESLNTRMKRYQPVINSSPFAAIRYEKIGTFSSSSNIKNDKAALHPTTPDEYPYQASSAKNSYCQQALAVPDPEPAVAVLNFHYIAIMAIECFTQYEIGDELGHSQGHSYDNNHDDEGDSSEYERVRDAKDADVDEIFFAVVDRWRAGRETKRESLGLIRGVQEFCDQVLDIIHYIKEHGLLKEEEMVGVSRKGKAKAAGTKRRTVAKPN